MVVLATGKRENVLVYTQKKNGSMVRIRSNVTALFGEKSTVPSCRVSSCLSKLWVGCSLPNLLPFIRFSF